MEDAGITEGLNRWGLKCYAWCWSKFASLTRCVWKNIIQNPNKMRQIKLSCENLCCTGFYLIISHQLEPIHYAKGSSGDETGSMPILVQSATHWTLQSFWLVSWGSGCFAAASKGWSAWLNQHFLIPMSQVAPPPSTCSNIMLLLIKCDASSILT